MGRWRLRYLADTHALIWYLTGSQMLPVSARATIEDDAHDILVSAATAWEITTKHRLGKLPDVAMIASDVEGALTRQGFRPLSISMKHAELSGRLPGPHRDPFDRMLIAQALTDNLILISNETRFDAFGVQRLW